MRSQISLVRAAADPRSRHSLGEQNGGSARGYQELFAPLASPTTAEQPDGQAVFYASAALGVNARI
jgi:hypothetical protein